MRLLVGVGLALLVLWLTLVVVLLIRRPESGALREAMRILPDTLRLLARLARDRAVPFGSRLRLWLLLAYLAMPIDLVPDFLPIIGHADDVILVLWVLRSVVRSAGEAAVRQHWPGTSEGLAVLMGLAMGSRHNSSQTGNGRDTPGP